MMNRNVRLSIDFYVFLYSKSYRFTNSKLNYKIIRKKKDIIKYEPFGLVRFATDHFVTKAVPEK